MKAPRAFPIVSGPVGFADTNSTFTAIELASSTRPQASGSARMPSIVAARASGRKRMFMKPGGATSTASIGESESARLPSRTSFAASSVASSRGERRYGRASFIARFVARSPWSGLAGCSTSIAGRAASSGSGGRAPDSMASVHARSMAARTWLRRGDGIKVSTSSCEVSSAVSNRTGARMTRWSGARATALVSGRTGIADRVGGARRSWVVRTTRRY